MWHSPLSWQKLTREAPLQKLYFMRAVWAGDSKNFKFYRGIIYFTNNLGAELTREDIKIIKGCLLTTKETFKCIPFKNKDMKNKIKQIDEVLEKICEGA